MGECVRWSAWWKTHTLVVEPLCRCMVGWGGMGGWDGWVGAFLWCSHVLPCGYNDSKVVLRWL